MFLVPVCQYFVDAAVRCVRNELAAALDDIFKAVVLRCIFLAHVYFDRRYADRCLRYDVILFTARCTVVTAGCDLGISGFHHDILCFRRNSLEIEVVALEVLIDCFQDIVFIALCPAVFIGPGKRTFRAGKNDLHVFLSVSCCRSCRRSCLLVSAASGNESCCKE